MISKNTIKIISISIACIVGIFVLLFIFKDQVPVFFPNQQKEITRTIHDKNIEAQVRIYIDKKAGKNLDIELIRESGDINELDKQVGTKQILYSHRLNSGEKYMIRVKNQTDSFIFTNVEIVDND